MPHLCKDKTDPAHVAAVEEALKSPATKLVLKELSAQLESRKKATSTKLHNKDSYKLPAWSENAADSLGYIRAITEIENLIRE